MFFIACFVVSICEFFLAGQQHAPKLIEARRLLGSRETLAAGWLVYLCMGLNASMKNYKDLNYELQAILANYNPNNKVVSLEAITACLRTF